MKGNGLFNKDNFWATLFIFSALIAISLAPIKSSIINPIEDVFEEVDLTDLVFSQLRNEPANDPHVVLVNVGNLNRAGIAEQIQIINQFKPKTIGVDVFFSTKNNSDSDSLLISTLSKVKNLVMISKPLKFNSETQEYDSIKTSDPQFLNNCAVASSTLITGAENQEDIKICRTFNPVFPIKGQEDQLAFGIKLVQYYNKEAATKFLSRKNEVETINFRGNHGNKFYTLDVDDVFNYNFTPDLIKGKIIIFGFLGSYIGDPSWEDKFFTPLNSKYIGRANPDMFGMEIHANVISMVLNGDYIDVVPEWFGIILAVVVCFLNVAFFSLIYRKKELYYTILTKPIQFIEVVLLLGIVILLFHYLSLKIDLSLMLITILLVGDMLELYYNYIKHTVTTLRQKLLLKINLLKNNGKLDIILSRNRK